MLLEYFEKSSIFKAELQAAYAWLAKPAAKATTTDERILGVVRYGERVYGSHDFQSLPSRIRINKVIRTIARTAIQPAGCTEVIFVGRTGAGGMRHGTREICLAYSARKPFAKQSWCLGKTCFYLERPGVWASVDLLTVWTILGLAHADSSRHAAIRAAAPPKAICSFLGVCGDKHHFDDKGARRPSQEMQAPAGQGRYVRAFNGSRRRSEILCSGPKARTRIKRKANN